eukprot:scaffold181352_cov31-Tisochrysis_lutea.AAC.3
MPSACSHGLAVARKSARHRARSSEAANRPADDRCTWRPCSNKSPSPDGGMDCSRSSVVSASLLCPTQGAPGAASAAEDSLRRGGPSSACMKAASTIDASRACSLIAPREYTNVQSSVSVHPPVVPVAPWSAADLDVRLSTHAPAPKTRLRTRDGTSPRHLEQVVSRAWTAAPNAIPIAPHPPRRNRSASSQRARARAAALSTATCSEQGGAPSGTSTPFSGATPALRFVVNP